MSDEAPTGQLSDRQRAFCEEYLVDLNATQAAIRAGYEPASARNRGYRLLEQPEVEAEVQRLMQARSEATGITAERVLKELACIGFVDLGKAFGDGAQLLNLRDMPEDVRRAIASFEVLAGSAQKLRFADKARALELIGKHLGMFTDKVEHSGPNGGPLLTLHGITPEIEQRIRDAAVIAATVTAPASFRGMGSEE